MTLAPTRDAKAYAKSTEPLTPGAVITFPAPCAVDGANAYAKSTDSVALILARLLKHEISAARLCREAGIDTVAFSRIRRGHTTPQRRILVRLTKALDRLIAAERANPPEAGRALYRAAFAAMAHEAGIDPALMDAPYSPCNFGLPAKIGQVRQAAFYLCVTALPVPRPVLAKLIGYSKQAASKALKDVEARRERDPAFDAAVNRTAIILTGEDLR